MAEIALTIDVDAPVDVLWAAVTDWERQGEWMVATSVRATAQDDVEPQVVEVAGADLAVGQADRAGVLERGLHEIAEAGCHGSDREQHGQQHDEEHDRDAEHRRSFLSGLAGCEPILS